MQQTPCYTHLGLNWLNIAFFFPVYLIFPHQEFYKAHQVVIETVGNPQGGGVARGQTCFESYEISDLLDSMGILLDQVE